MKEKKFVHFNKKRGEKGVERESYLLTSGREDWSLTKYAISSFAAPASTFFKNNLNQLKDTPRFFLLEQKIR